jgi:hypothetical protein
MNFIIKGLVKKILTQYLNIQNDKLDLESGTIKLLEGTVNAPKIN